MTKRISLLVAIVLALSFTTALAADYLPQNRCVMCHKGAKKGNIYENWMEGPHAKAFKTLQTDAAKAAYTGEMTADTDPACLKCHVTNGPEGTDKLDKALGVTCQECHGAGGDYWKMSIMKDREAAIANGMVANPKENCTDCHNEESPTFKGFELEKYWGEIQHSATPVE